MTDQASSGPLAGRLRQRRNRFLNLLRTEPGINRRECARRLGVSGYSISKLSRQLLQEGVIFEGPSQRPGTGAGRPVIPLHISGDCEIFGGLDIEAYTLRFAVVDFAGIVRYTDSTRLRPGARGGDYAQQITDFLARQSERCPFWHQLSAVGIGAPGAIDYKSGTVLNYSVLPGFSDVPVRDLAGAAVGRPVHLIWNIRALAVFAGLKHPKLNRGWVLHIGMRSGIASVFTHDGNLLRGSRRRAGEVGLFPVCHSDGTVGPLEQFSGLRALRRELPQLPSSFWDGDGDALAAAWQRQEIRSVLEPRLDLFARFLCGLTFFGDLDRIIVYGTLFSDTSPLWLNLQEQYRRYLDSYGEDSAYPTELLILQNSTYAAAAGAALHALYRRYPVTPPIS